MEFNIYICYTLKHLRRGAPLDLALQEMQLSDIAAAGTTKANTQIFHQTLLSFAMILFGTQHRQASITKHGYAIYGAALKQLNYMLQTSKFYSRDDVILSVVTFAILECYVPTGPKNYLMHMTGVERLLELRGPTSLCSPESTQLYRELRHMILFASLRTGKASILAREEWKAAFRASCSAEEIPEQDLFDVLADCTVLAAEYDDILTIRDPDPESSSRQQDELYQKGLDLLNQLHIWRSRWNGDEDNSYFETPVGFAKLELGREPLADELPPFLTTFEFSNNRTAIMLMFYYTTLIHVFRILTSLTLENLRTYSNESPTPNTLQNTGYLDDVWKQTKHGNIAAERSVALQICRCIPDYLKRNSSLATVMPPIFQWTVTTAWMTFRGTESAEGKWLMKLLHTNNREVIAKGLLAG
ncbi:hypothetical protein BP6252_12528 [Coleophoma cylindrospora]|uniref:Transcription factor domain-containing protein n=1 Tax=Coleophoma cylindrospora TaxID=1849047 RepID=A0A3D8QCH9_9HELO|nr:hypothetical protein BP6252_12528 [Coleophoma cylindrospora]